MSRDVWKRFGMSDYIHDEVAECCFKYNIIDQQAATGVQQLRRFETDWLHCKATWESYTRDFSNLRICVPEAAHEDERHAHQRFPVLVDAGSSSIGRDRCLEGAKRPKIGVGVRYESISDRLVYLGNFGWRPGDYLNTLNIGQCTARLPLSAAVTVDDLADVIETIRDTHS